MGYYDPPDPAEAGDYSPSSPCKGDFSDQFKVAPRDTVALIQQAITFMEQGDNQHAAFTLGGLVALINEMPHAEGVECNYDGMVDGFYGGTRHGGTVSWTCPRCGHEGDEEVYPDEPDRRDDY